MTETNAKPHRALMRGVELLTGLLLFVGVGELAVRLVNPTPRLQIVRMSRTEDMEAPLRWVDGEPVWRMTGSEARTACPGPRPRQLAVFGDSIGFGHGLTAAETFTAGLQARLDRAQPGVWCVRNHAQPGYVITDLTVDAAHLLAERPAGLVVLEANAMGDYTRVGDDAWNFDGLRVDAGGLPTLLPTPPELNRWLFERSRLWGFLHLSLTPLDANPAASRARTWARLDAFRARLGAVPLAVAVPPSLVGVIHPASDEPETTRASIVAWCADRGVPCLDLGDALAGQDGPSIAHTPVHFNAAGHAILTSVFLDWLRSVQLLPPAPPDAEPPSAATPSDAPNVRDPASSPNPAAPSDAPHVRDHASSPIAANPPPVDPK
jgi:hypothetical protein